MNDEQMQPLLDTWYRDREVAPRDVREGVARVMAKVPQTRQQGRWWPLPVFDRPAPIPPTSGPTPARGFTMFSAVKFMVAGVIVALFGGFLLAGVLTMPQGDETLSAAVTESPSPMTTEELLSGMVTEEVEPGVLQVVNDGVRDLSMSTDDFDPFLDGSIVAGLDGHIWLFLPDQLFRLGGESQPSPRWLESPRRADIEVGPDGHVWLIAQREDGSADLVRFGPGLGNALIWGDPAWPEYAERDYLGVEVERDGTVRAAWLDAPGSVPDHRKVNVGHYMGGWAPLPALRTERSVFEWDFEVSGDDIWLAEGELANVGPGSLHRFDGSVWLLEEPPFAPAQTDVGPDGTLWMQASDWDQGVCGLRLARFDGTDWQAWGRDDGVPDVGPVFFYGGCQEGIHAAAPDGSVWLAPLDFMAGRECTGIADFDGTTWSHFLEGLCVYDADIAPDGAVWLQAGEVRYQRPTEDDPSLPGGVQEFGPVHTYVITPEAVAGTE